MLETAGMVTSLAMGFAIVVGALVFGISEWVILTRQRRRNRLISCRMAGFPLDNRATGVGRHRLVTSGRRHSGGAHRARTA